MIGRIPKATDNYAFTNSHRIGSPCWVDPKAVQLDVWHRVKDPATGQEDGHCQRTGMRSLRQVFADLKRKLDLIVCPECGWMRKRKQNDCCTPCLKCKAETYWYIDEYFHGPDVDALVPHNFRWIACYAVTGGSEGHYIHIDFMVPVDMITAEEGEYGDPEHKHDVSVNHCGLWRMVRLALGKTFRGMDHACDIARRCAVLLGA